MSLQPEPIPLDVKIVLVGPPMLYYLLSRSQDDDFAELFKIAADFDDRVERTADTTLLYARVIADDRAARAAARRSTATPSPASSSRRRGSPAMPTGCRPACGRSSSCCRRPTSSPPMPARRSSARPRCRPRSTRSSAAATASIAACRRRSAASTIRIETDGEVVGQVNGLSVISLGALAFGNPTPDHRAGAPRAAARSSISSARSQLGGPLHSKGVLILTGFLGGRFGGDPAAVAERQPGLRAILWRGRRRQRLGGRAVRAALGAGRGADPAMLRGHRLGRPARPASRRSAGSTRRSRGFSTSARLTGLHRPAGRHHPGEQRQAPDAAPRYRRRGGRRAASAIIPIETIDQGLELLTGRARPTHRPINQIAARLDDFAAKAAALMRSQRGRRS